MAPEARRAGGAPDPPVSDLRWRAGGGGRGRAEHGRRARGDLEAAEVLEVTHTVGLFLLVLAAALMKYEIGGPAAWLLVGKAVVLVVYGRRACRMKLLLDARRLGLRDEDAREHARRRMLELAERNR